VVIYNNSATVFIEEGDLENKEILIEKINTIEPGGGTTISSGLGEGGSILEKYGSEYLKRVFLFTDGLDDQKKGAYGVIFNIVDNLVSKGINVSAYGLGNDFDEELMRKIGEKGCGNYFYIESAKDITRMMSHSIHGLVEMVGSNCIVTFNDEDGRLNKIYDSENGNVYSVGDLTNGGAVNILLQYKVSPPKGVEDFKIFSYNLRYTTGGTREDVGFEGSFVVACTKNYKDIEINRDVLVSIKLKEYREHNGEIKQYINSNNISEAIKMKENLMKGLEEFRDEPSGRVEKILRQEEEGLIALKDSPKGSDSYAKAKKKFDAVDYMVKKENKFDYHYNSAENSSCEEDLNERDVTPPEDINDDDDDVSISG